ncbi:MAG TPA: hypothetical protein PK264_12050 [Hyphomicrobiaceae bacterium]|nr:hypothetical protein [Hyphomicrobiaceae bacterium]
MMSLRSLPLMIIPFIIYNILAYTFSGTEADAVFRDRLFDLPLGGGRKWTFSKGDLVMLLVMLCLFFELIKSTWTGSSSLIDHGLSMLVFIFCLIEFILVPRAATSVFFFIMVAALIDVIAGYTIGIRVARRDVSFGGDA